MCRMYSNLNAELARYNISKKEVGKLLEVSSGTLRNKMNREKSDFTISEFQSIYDTYFRDKGIDFLYLIEFKK